jgi:hypothetical protein
MIGLRSTSSGVRYRALWRVAQNMRRPTSDPRSYKRPEEGAMPEHRSASSIEAIVCPARVMDRTSVAMRTRTNHWSTLQQVRVTGPNGVFCISITLFCLALSSTRTAQANIIATSVFPSAQPNASIPFGRHPDGRASVALGDMRDRGAALAAFARPLTYIENRYIASAVLARSGFRIATSITFGLAPADTVCANPLVWPRYILLTLRLVKAAPGVLSLL